MNTLSNAKDTTVVP
jgi:hypothetical protein